MAVVCSNKLQLEIKKKEQMIYHPLLFFFFMSLGIRHQNLCERGLSEISTSLSLPFTLVFLLIFLLYFFFLLSWWRSRPESRAQKVFRTQYLLRLIIKVSAAEKVEPFPLRALTCSIRLRIFPWLWLWFWFFVFLFSCYPFAVVIFLVNVNGRRDLSRKCLWQCHHLGALGLAQ